MTLNAATLTEEIDSDNDGVDATALLVADHDEVREMFIEYHELVRGNGFDEERAELVDQICQTLTLHATLEEELFYPAARDALGTPGPTEKAEHEHAQARILIEQLQGMAPSDDVYDDTVQQLQQAVEQHVQEEEEELFPQVRESSLDMLALGMQMADRKDELLYQTEAQGIDG